MAVSLIEYNSLEFKRRNEWSEAADVLERDIDTKLEAAIETNLVPNKVNPKHVLRYVFSQKIETPIKDILKVRYGQVGWKIIENVDFKDGLNHGYFDFYKK